MPQRTPDAALDDLHEAALAFTDSQGLAAYHDWLRQETSRLRMLIKARQAHPEAIVASPIGEVQLLLDALSFYADDSNWTGPAKRPPAAHLDKGAIARKALADYEGESDAD
jgi:hypothetical protein